MQELVTDELEAARKTRKLCKLYLEASNSRAFAFLGQIRKGQAQVAGIGRVGYGRLHLHDAFADEPLKFPIEMLHAILSAIMHGVEQALSLVLALLDILPGAHCGLQDLDDGDPVLPQLELEKAFFR
jgi:hypothetical protein